MDLKNFGTIVLKNAINAIITSSALSVFMSGTFNFRSMDGWKHIGAACLSAVIAREVAVWGPVLLKWSTTNADPGVQVIQTPPGQPNIIEPKA